MGTRISEFDLWRPGYAGAKVYFYVAGSSSLADIYEDIESQIPAENPQTLMSMVSADGTRYGKFSTPIYTSQSYYMSINANESTGTIVPPISSIEGEDISGAEITPTGSNHSTRVDEFASMTIIAPMYGDLVSGAGGIAADNTTTIELAIAAAENGGIVYIPSGSFNVNAFEIPEGVIISGAGREATILQSEIGDKSFTIVGSRAGFRDITLDGLTLQTGSIAVFSADNDEIVFDSVMIRRFETGLHFKGGKGHIWNDLSIENTETGSKLHGDTTDSGSSFSDLIWSGGLVSVATTIGVSLSYEDARCHNIHLKNVGFEDCIGTALDINGAQFVRLDGYWFDGNTKNINIQDDSDLLTPSTQQNNDVYSVRFDTGRFNGGEVEVTGSCEDIIIVSSDIRDVDFTLSTPLQNALILENCSEDDSVTITGESTKLLRRSMSKDGVSIGVTVVNVATKAWSTELKPGQLVLAEATVLGIGRNVVQRGIYKVVCGAYRPGSTLLYDSQTSNFTAGAIITGASSGATARIQSDTDGGTTGTLVLIDIDGEFIDNEIIQDDNATPGSATVNGTLTPSNVSLDTVGNVNVRTAYETNVNWAAAFAANGTELELRVTGDTSQTVEWIVDVKVVTT